MAACSALAPRPVLAPLCDQVDDDSVTKLMMKLNASFMLQVRGRPLIALHPASSQFIFKDGVPKPKMAYVQRKCMHGTLKHIFEEAREASNGNGLRIQTPDSRPGSSRGVAAQFAARFLFVCNTTDEGAWMSAQSHRQSHVCRSHVMVVTYSCATAGEFVTAFPKLLHFACDSPEEHLINNTNNSLQTAMPCSGCTCPKDQLPDPTVRL